MVLPLDDMVPVDDPGPTTTDPPVPGVGLLLLLLHAPKPTVAAAEAARTNRRARLLVWIIMSHRLTVAVAARLARRAAGGSGAGHAPRAPGREQLLQVTAAGARVRVGAHRPDLGRSLHLHGALRDGVALDLEVEQVDARGRRGRAGEVPDQVGGRLLEAGRLGVEVDGAPERVVAVAHVPLVERGRGRVGEPGALLP